MNSWTVPSAPLALASSNKASSRLETVVGAFPSSTLRNDTLGPFLPRPPPTHPARGTSFSTSQIIHLKITIDAWPRAGQKEPAKPTAQAALCLPDVAKVVNAGWGHMGT